MARKNKVVTEVEAKTGKAKKNLKDLDAQARKTGKGFGQTAKGGRSADRAMKGVSAQSSNSSKNFSKMSQGMTGGLVPAYATLAAQIFAVTALFRFLQQAADYRVLIEGQKAFAAETGIAYNTIAKSLQKATDGQLNFKDASQAAAIASAAGVNPDQLERLAKGARNVSIALGRDLTDSFNRLIRGTTKAEPELLDELGIILRLEEATKKYADSIGKTKEQLTIYEKSQAVTLEVLDQVEGKFGAIGENAELQVSALSQFAKAFDDVINKVYEFIGPIAEGLARFFSKNLYAFMGALTIFAIPIIKMILPSFDAWTQKAIANADAHKIALESQRTDLQKYRTELAATKSKAGFAKGQFGGQAKTMGLSGGARGKAKAIAHYEKQTTQLIKGEITKRTGILANASKREVRQLKSKYAQMQGHTTKFTVAVNRQFQGMSARFKIVTTTMKAHWSSTMAFMSKTASKVGKFMNKAFSILMIVSLLVMVWDMIKPYLGFVDKEDKYAESVKAASDLNKELKLMGDRFNQKILKGTGNTLADAIEGLQYRGNMATSANLDSRLKEYMEADPTGRASLRPELLKSVDSLAKVDLSWANLNRRLQAGGLITEDVAKEMRKLTRDMLSGKAAADLLKQSIIDFSKAENDFVRSKTKGTYNLMIDAAMGRYKGGKEAMEIAQGDKGRAVLERTLVGQQRKAYTDALPDDIVPDEGILKGYDDQIITLTGLVKLAQDQIEATSAAARAGRLAYEKYTGYATQESIRGREGDRLKQRKVGIGARAGALADQTKREITLLQKKLQINKALDQLEILKGIRLKEAGDKTKSEWINANQAVLNQESNLLLLGEEKIALENLISPMKRLGDAMHNSFAATLTQGIEGLIMGTKSLGEAFADMAKSIIGSMAKIVAELMAEKLLRAMFGDFSIGAGTSSTSSKMGPGDVRYGGIMSKPGYRSFSQGGIATGNSGPGYLANLHGTEAVVPLGNDRSIPVKMMGGAGNVNNTNVVVNVEGGQATSQTTGESQGAAIGKMIAASIEERLVNESRPGGLLNRGGGG